MTVEIIPPNESGDSRHLVDINSLPPDALSAILKKLNERRQRVTQVFNDDYIITIENIGNLINKLYQEFHDSQHVSDSISVTIHLSSNQRFDFSSWEEFKLFDSSQAETTKSITLIFTYDLITRSNNVERYSVQLSIQNIPHRFGIYLGPINVRRIEDAGIPPVPIHTTVEFSNYVRGKNIINTIESWIRSTKINERNFIAQLQRSSRKIASLCSFSITLTTIIGCMIFIPPNDANIRDLGVSIYFSIIFIYLGHKIGRILSNFLEQQIDTQSRGNIISLTNGDDIVQRKISNRNNTAIIKSILTAITILTQITVNIASDYIKDALW